MYLIYSLFKYAWFTCSLIGLLNLAVIGFRVNCSLKEKQITKIEGRKILQQVSAFLLVPFGLIGLLQVIGGFEDPFFFAVKDLNIYIILAWGVLLFWWLVILYWILLKDGARILIKYRNILGMRIPESEGIVKVFLLIILGMAISGTIKMFYI